MNRRALITIAALVTCASGMLHAQSNDAPPIGKATVDKLTLDSLFEKFSLFRYDRRAPLSVKTTGLIAHKLYQLESGRKRYEKTLRRILDEHWDAAALVIQAKHIAAMVLPYMNERQKLRLPSSLERALTFMLTREGELLQEIENGMPQWPMWRPGPPPVIDNDRPGRDPKKGGEQRKK